MLTKWFYSVKTLQTETDNVILVPVILVLVLLVPVILMRLTLHKTEFHINFINAVASLFCPIVEVLKLDMIIILNTV